MKNGEEPQNKMNPLPGAPLKRGYEEQVTARRASFHKSIKSRRFTRSAVIGETIRQLHWWGFSGRHEQSDERPVHTKCGMEKRKKNHWRCSSAGVILLRDHEAPAVHMKCGMEG